MKEVLTIQLTEHDAQRLLQLVRDQVEACDESRAWREYWQRLAERLAAACERSYTWPQSQRPPVGKTDKNT